jgi:hypothetical protein
LLTFERQAGFGCFEVEKLRWGGRVWF